MKRVLIITMILLAYPTVHAQVKIGDNPASIQSSSLLEMESTDKGLLIPRMTISERQAIGSPVKGLLVFQNDSTEGFYYYTGTEWKTLLSDTSVITHGGRHLNVVGKGAGSTKPTTTIVGNTICEQFQIGDELFFDVAHLDDYAGGDVEVEIDFVAMGAESSKTVRWNVVYNVHEPFEQVDLTTGTIDSGDLALVSTQYGEQDITFTIPESEMTNAEAIHFKLIRSSIGSGSNPSNDPAVIHATVSFNVYH